MALNRLAFTQTVNDEDPDLKNNGNTVTTDSEQLENADRLFRRDLLVGVCMFLIPVLLVFSARETLQQNPYMASLSAMGAMLLTILWYSSKNIGINMHVLRGTVAYFVFLLLFYTATTGTSSALMLCLLIPLISTLIFGYREAVIWNTVTCSLVLYVMFQFELISWSNMADEAINFIAAYASIAFITALYDRLLDLGKGHAASAIDSNKTRGDRIEEQSLRQFEDLLKAVKEVRELNGIIPICSSCKMVRAEEDLWEHLEPFLDKRTQLTFSHGVCPTCTEETMDNLNHTWACR